MLIMPIKLDTFMPVAVSWSDFKVSDMGNMKLKSVCFWRAYPVEYSLHVIVTCYDCEHSLSVLLAANPVMNSEPDF